MQNMRLIHTSVPNLDSILGGGVPAYSLCILAGQPGTGKTILAQQMLFGLVSSPQAEESKGKPKALYLTTLSEPTLKVVRYMQRFSFFDADAFGEQVIYQDVGRIVRERTLPEVAAHILDLVETHHPQILVVDSFKAISDLTKDLSDFRMFCFDLSIRLASARCTTFLVGEYDRSDLGQRAEFAVADGILYLDIARQEGEHRRFLHVPKMRGQATAKTSFPFVIDSEGIHILSLALTLRRREGGLEVEAEQVATGIAGLDGLLRGGIPRGRSVILSGVSGTGKTTFGLQFLIHGAEQGEKGLLFTFEESPDRLRRMAEGFGWNLRDLEEKGVLRTIFIPQTDIRVEENLEQMVRQVESFQPRRLVVDSFSVFLHKVNDPAVQREKTFQLATLVQRAGAVGLLISDIPAEDSGRLSRFGVEETVADGTIVLTSEMVGLQRKRYVEVYKMRAADHMPGRHRMEITGQGVEVFYTMAQEPIIAEPPPPLVFQPVQDLLHGKLAYGSAWLVRGDPGVGKSTLAHQFAIDGLHRREAILYVAADAPAAQVHRALQGLGFLPDPYLESGQLVIMDAFTQVTGRLDLTDPEAFLFSVARQVRQMPKPLRLIFDSLTPLALGYKPDEFVALVHRKNRLLRQANVVLFDTMLQRMLAESQLYSLLNAFDVVVELYTPNWGDMGVSGNGGYRALRLRKVRGTSADSRPYPYVISTGEGIVVQKDFYRSQMGA